MATHVKLLAWLNIIYGGLIAVAGLVVFLIMGGIAGFVGASASPDDRVAVPILGMIGGFVFIVLLVLSLPSIVTGIGLLHYKPWARIVGIVLSALHLPGIPFGTALGIYGLWVLLNRETEMLLQSPPVQYAPRPYGT
jgi:hypothetical protein